jgi:hypothetical protein
MLVVNTGESMGAKTMFPDPKIDTELMVLIFVAETKVSCLLAKPRIKRVYCIIPSISSRCCLNYS